MGMKCNLEVIFRGKKNFKKKKKKKKKKNLEGCTK